MADLARTKEQAKAGVSLNDARAANQASGAYTSGNRSVANASINVPAGMDPVAYAASLKKQANNTYNTAKLNEGGADANPATMNAKIKSASSKTSAPPSVITSDKAKEDFANKKSQMDQLGIDVQNQKNGINSPIDQNFFKKPEESIDEYKTRVDAYREANPAQSLDSQIDELLGGGGEQKAPEELSPEEQQIQDTISQQADLENEADQQYGDTIKTLDSIRKGTYPLTASEHSLLDSTKQMYMATVAAQKTANTAYEGQLTEMNASLGISTSAPSQAIGVMTAAINSGNQKVATLDAQMASSLADLQQGFEDKAYNEVIDKWNIVSKHIDDRRTALKEMHDAAQDAIDKLGMSQRDTAIAGLVDGGMTDATTVLGALGKLGYQTDLDTVSKAMKDISEAKISPDIITSTDGRGNTYGINKDTGDIVWTAKGTSRALGGGSGSGYMFTNSQLNKGAANAGKTLQEFQQMDGDSQNLFINGDVKGTKKTIDDELTSGTSPDEVISAIGEMALPPDAEQYFIDYANGNAEDSLPPTIEETQSTFEDTLRSLQRSGYKRSEAYDAVLNELTDNGKSSLPSAQKNALRAAQDSIFGSLMSQDINVWGGGPVVKK